MKVAIFLITIVILRVSIMKLNASINDGLNDNQYRFENEQLHQASHPDYENSEVMTEVTFVEHIEMYRKFFFEKGEKYPDEPLPQEKLDLFKLLSSTKGLSASWLGHSSILLNIDGYSILTDPLFKRKVSPIGPTRFNREHLVDIDDLPPINVVIISHDHYDHLNKPSIRLLKEKVGIFIVPLRVGGILQKWGVSPDKIIELDWWEEFQLKDDLKIVATPSQHFSGRGLFDRNKNLWASWVIQTNNSRVFFSGDSGYFGGFKDIGDKYGPFDVTFLECGAYNKQWPKVHMFPEQTVQAFFDLKGKVLQPIHWATFNLALHAWYEPIERLFAKANSIGATLSTPTMGQIVDYQRPIVTDFWWVPAIERGKQKQTLGELVAAGE